MTSPNRRWYVLAQVLALSACGRKHVDQAALSPQESLNRILLSDDFRVELFASEPEVVDPVEMVFDENDRIYVAEMIDYPDDPPPGQPARSRIRVLEDTNGDGRIDRSSVFAERLLQVSGILAWKGGLLASSAPDILFLKDTDGDGRADVREVWYTGFTKVNPEARITNLRLGLDNWIYAANHGSDGRITSPKNPQHPPVLVRGADFRFRPDRGQFERSSGPAQFGLTMDEWGNRFITENTIHLRHAVLPMHYLARAPNVAVPRVSHDLYPPARRPARMFPHTRPQAWRVERSGVRQKRYDENKLGRTEHPWGYITGASGGTIYSGDVFPREYWGNLFTGDVSASLVRRDILTPDGVTFSARPASDTVEFLASSDVWFRPCNFANAPDGNLYLLDIYREFIETPESIPESIKKGMDFWSGSDRGRIYRIAPRKPLRTRSLKPNLGGASTAELVKELENPNGWHRQTAQRLLVDRQDRGAVPMLRLLAQKGEWAVARTHALWTLEGLAALDTDDVAGGLKDSHPGVREQSLRLAEPFLSRSAPVRAAVLALAGDSSVRVVFQLAFTLGEVDDPAAIEALARIAAARGQDAWFRAAILSSVANRPVQFLRRLDVRGPGELLSELSSLIGVRRQADEIAVLLQKAPAFSNPESALRGLAKGLRLAGGRGLVVAAAEPALSRLLELSPEAVRLAAWEVAAHVQLGALAGRAAGEALATQLSIPRRAAAIRALAGGSLKDATPVIRRVLSSNPAPELQIASIEALSGFGDLAAALVVVDLWKSYGPLARPRAMAALLERSQWTPVLLEALERGQVDVAAVDVAARVRLRDHPDAQIARRANALLRPQGDRAAVVATYTDALKLAGDVARGRQAFDEHCARCHMPRLQGGRVGPDLSGVNNKTREELLTSILDPSYAIESRFVNYIVTTKDGRIYDGVISNETPSGVTLRGGSSESDETILRGNIAEIRASAISLMPDELEKSLGRQALADVIAYLRAGL